MKNQLIKNLKNIVCSGLLCAGINYNVESSIITRHDLDRHVRQTAEQFLAAEGFGPFYIPARLQADYEQKLQSAKQDLLNLLARRHQSYLDTADVYSTIRTTMRPFIQNLASIIHDYQLEGAVTSAIQGYLATKGLTQDTIPAREVAEYINRSGKVMDELKRLMRTNGNRYVRVVEIERTIDKQLKLFVNRIATSQTYNNYGHYNQPAPAVAPFDWYDFFFNTPAAPAPGPSTQGLGTGPVAYDADKIMNYELEQRVTSAAANVIRTYNVDPNKIPARAVAEYAEKTQRALHRLRDLMSQTGRTFVWKDELEQTCLQEIQSVIDKINYKGEMCSICLDNYSKGNRVGILSCGHSYHRDCIYTWLGQQKTCPLCRAQNVFVAQIETVA